jgi:hypothetical protein
MTIFTNDEISKLPKWAIIKVLELQKSESDLRQRTMGHAAQAVFDAAREYVLVTSLTHTADDIGKAKLKLRMAVSAWEEWASDQYWESNTR